MNKKCLMRETIKKYLPACFIAAFVLVIVQIFVIAYYFKPDFITLIDESYMIDSPGQDRIHTLYKVAKVRREYDPEAVKVYILGGSAVRDTYDDGIMSEMLSKKSGQKVKYASFGNYSQDFFDSYMLTASLPRDKKTIVILGINLVRFRPNSRLDVNDRHNILTIPFIWRYAKEGLELLPEFDRNYLRIGFWDTINFIRLRVSFRLQDAVRKAIVKAREGSFLDALGEVSYLWARIEHQRYQESPITKLISKERLARDMPDTFIPIYKENKQVNYDMIRNIIKINSLSNAETVLFLGPISPLGMKADESVLPDITNELTAIIENSGAGVRAGAGVRGTVMTSEKIFTSDDYFYDLVHLNDLGRQQTMNGFATELTDLINKL